MRRQQVDVIFRNASSTTQKHKFAGSASSGTGSRRRERLDCVYRLCAQNRFMICGLNPECRRGSGLFTFLLAIVTDLERQRAHA